MKLFFVFITALLMSGCYPVRYERQEFVPVERKSFAIGNATLNLRIFSSSYGSFNAKNRGPWWLSIIVKGGGGDGPVSINKLKITSREGVVLEIQEFFNLRCVKIEGGGVYWDSAVEQSFSPDFYDEQQLGVVLEVEINGIVKIISHQFYPKKISGRERVNLLTM